MNENNIDSSNAEAPQTQDMDLSKFTSGLYEEIFHKIDPKYAALQAKYKDNDSLDDKDVGQLTDLSFTKLLILQDMSGHITNEILAIIPVGEEKAFHAARKKHARINMFVGMFKDFVDSKDGEYIPTKTRASINLAIDTLTILFEEIQMYQQAYLENGERLKICEYDRVALITQTHMNVYSDLLFELKYLVKNTYNTLMKNSPLDILFYDFNPNKYPEIM